MKQKTDKFCPFNNIKACQNPVISVISRVIFLRKNLSTVILMLLSPKTNHSNNRLREVFGWMMVGIFMLCSGELRANDTIFITKHHFEEPVNNVFLANGKVYAKVGSHIYRKDKNSWEMMSSGEYKKYFVFYDKDFFEHDYIPKEHLYENLGFMKDLIPQRALTNATIVRDGNAMFVSTGGSLFEYQINTTYSVFFSDKSIRHIFKEPGLSVYSTYGGIYLRRRDSTMVTAKGLGHSNGNYLHSPLGDIIASDFLFGLSPADSFVHLPINFGVQQGKVRKAIMKKDTLMIMLTNSICAYHKNTGLQTLVLNDEFTDLEVLNDSILFTNADGKLFSMWNGKTRLLCDVGEKVRDIFPIAEGLYLAAFDGVHFYRFDEGRITKTLDVKRTSGVVRDNEQNLWVATDGGLFVIPQNEEIIIPFIKNVEFNRGALTYYNDTVYAGSINGLYVIDAWSVSKLNIPAAIHKVNVHNRQLTVAGIIGLIVASLTTWFTIAYLRKRRKILVPADTRPKKTVGKAEIEQDILTHNIQTVEGLAEHLHTNTVQLNRMFKSFNTTPGKFLKTVKINLARQMLRDGKPMQEVVAATGYSAQLIKSELRKTGEMADSK
jgi:AraC-like DNA-binding protein